jgi:hypothetical protein
VTECDVTRSSPNLLLNDCEPIGCLVAQMSHRLTALDDPTRVFNRQSFTCLTEITPGSEARPASAASLIG